MSVNKRSLKISGRHNITCS